MITSPRNRQVIKAVRLKKRAIRDRERRFLVEGAQVTAEALHAGSLEAVFHVPGGAAAAVAARAEEAGVPVRAVSPEVMAHLTSAVTPQGLVGVARFADVPLSAIPAGATLVPVLCSVRDPGNAGTIVRSADAAGADAVVFTEASVDPYNAKTVRATAGSLFHLPLVRGATVEEAVEALRARGAQILGTAADGETSLYDADLARPTAVLLGNEAWGLEAEVRALADRTVRIPIRGRAESLNLAAAAALVLFESARARETPAGAASLASLAAAAAHDLRSPLSALTGLITTLGGKWDRIDPARRREMVEGMALDGHRVASLLRLLLDVMALEAGGGLPGAGEAEDAAAAAGWAAGVVAGVAGRPTASVEGPAPTAVGADRLRALVLALCDGALWWGSQGPLEIRVERAGAAAEVAVRRAGDGPTPEEAATLLEDPARAGRVALYLARRVAEACGGTLRCEGGDGVTFRLTVPAGPPPPRSA